VEEVRAGIAILKAAGLRREGVRFVSCPTCGRTQIDLIALAQEVEQRLQGLEREITVAVMGCVVNGPGEAHEADYGIAGGKDKIKLKTSGNVARVTRDIFHVTGEGDQVATITWTVEPGAHTA